MGWIRTTSGKLVILLTLIFSFSIVEKIEKINSGEKTCNCAYDGFGYYMYLPHFFEKGHLNIEKEWAQNLQNKYCDGIVAYQLEEHWTGNNIDIYHMGLSLLMLPSYAVADLFANAYGYETDGFSYPYMIAYLLNVLLFIFLGLLFLRKLLRLFGDELMTSVVMLVVVLGANTYFTFINQYDLPHLYVFVLNAASFYHLMRYYRDDTKRSLWFSALLFGLTVCIRPTQAIFGIIPFILLLQKHGKSKEFAKKITLYPILAVVCNIPQILYWKIIGGEFYIMNLHTEDLVLTDPNLLDFLFSYRKGWLLYSPLFVLLPIGWWLMYRKDRVMFIATLSFTAIYIYVMSSWECWWYAASFGQRVMVDIYPILAIPLVHILIEIRKPALLAMAGIFALGCIFLNLFQSRQVELGILDGYRMSKEHYWHIFGELDATQIHKRFLLIDRANTNWPNEIAPSKDPEFGFKSTTLKKHKMPVISEPGVHMSLGKIHVLKTFGTDETLVEVMLKFRTSDSTQSSLLRMECVSPWNCYSWNNTEISMGRRQNTIIYDTLRFNLPDIRHANDSMQMYIWNESKAKIELLDMKIRGVSLIRK